MQKIILKLKEISKKIDLSHRINFPVDTNSEIFNLEEKKILIDKNPLEQNRILKSIIQEKYKLNANTNIIDFYIINVWGGIRSFKNNETNKAKIDSFKKMLTSNKLNLDSFNTISSLSKIASFINPEKFVIYDSRVIYTLNWLILTCENNQSFKVPYFPIPSGRNKIISDFDINTILNLIHLKEYKLNKSIYRPYKNAYFEYCDFVKSATKIIFGEHTKPYELELLLFSIADNEVFEEIQSKISINLL